MTNHIPDIPAATSPSEILKAGMEAAGGPVSLACSFSPEDVAIIDIAHAAGLPLGVFALDTGIGHFVGFLVQPPKPSLISPRMMHLLPVHRTVKSKPMDCTC
jgi:hypothetical protein